MRNRIKGDVQWYLPKKKRPIAYSTVSTKLLVDTLAEEDKTRTIKDVYNLINYNREAKDILKIYVDKGYGNELAYKWFH